MRSCWHRSSPPVWDSVLQEAKEAEIPVVLLDRQVDSSDDLYLTAVGSDLVHEGPGCRRMAGRRGRRRGMPCGRAAGHDRLFARHRSRQRVPRGDRGPCQISRSCAARPATSPRSGGKQVMESFLQAEGGGSEICALYAHNDDMAIGAIQAIKGSGPRTRRGHQDRVDRCGAGHLPGHGGPAKRTPPSS